MKKWSIFLVVIIIAFTAGCISGPPYIIVADMNNDGLSDAVITVYGAETGENTISVFFGGANESFAREIVKDDIEKNSTIVADLNKDGKSDIVYKIFDSDRWKVLYGNGDGTFQRRKDVEAIDMKQFIKPD